MVAGKELLRSFNASLTTGQMDIGMRSCSFCLLKARIGYALDSDDLEILINRAPCATRFKVKVIGRAAHAGVSPEQGINAIQMAAKALTDLPLRRIDEITTANVGLIHGGRATNIVPDKLEVAGEVRSHDPERLRDVQDQILEIFHRTVEGYKKKDQGLPRVETEVIDDYPLMSVPEGHIVVTNAMKAAEAIGRRLRLGITGGGSDANILNSKGLTTLLMGVGMHNVHTTSEFIRLDDMVASAELVLQIISGV
jgi:tripeptide aminopeptidase